MTDRIPRAEAEVFYRALGENDYATVAKYLADDVDWTIGGPVDLLPFCGNYRGKAAVLDLLEWKIPSILANRRLVADALLVDGNHAAALSRLTAKKRKDGHSISYRIAQFFTFRAGKLVEYFSVIDSFDAVEQMIGQHIDMAPGHQDRDSNSILVTV